MQLKQNIFTQKNLWYAIALLLAVYMVATPFTLHPTLYDKGPAWLGLDASWQMTMNYALLQNWTWGRDIIFSYGPLAFLSTRVGLGISIWVFLLFDLFVALNFFFVFNDFLQKAADKFLAVLILVAISLLVNTYIGADLSWVLLFFIIYWIQKTHYDQGYTYLTILIILTVLTFYIKMNTGLIAIFFLFVHLGNLQLSHKISKQKLLYIPLLFLSLIIISSLLLHVSIFNYIKNSADLIRGYNDIMYLDEKHTSAENWLYLVFYMLLLFFVLRLGMQLKEKRYHDIVFTLACILYVFTLQKQSILRNDVEHMYEYLSFAPLILLCGHFTANGKTSKTFLNYAFIATLCSLFGISEKRTIAASIYDRALSVPQYMQEAGEYGSVKFLDQNDKRHIPKHILDKIDSQTVDIFPWDAEYILENKLNYTPRPVFQSFAAVTENLEQINYNFYIHRAPKFVLYEYNAIDERCGFNDESLVNLFIANNYTFVDSFTSNERLMLLLQKKQKTEPLKLTAWKKEQVVLSKEIDASNASFLKMNVSYTLKGLLRSIWNKPPKIRILYMTSEGEWIDYKTSKELLHSGVFIGRAITNTSDYLAFVTARETLQPITKVRLEIDSNYFASTGTVEFYNKSAYTNDTNFITLGYRELVLQNPNQVLDADGKKVIAIWGGEVKMKPVSLPKGKYKLSVAVNGTSLRGIFPHLNVFIDSNKIGSNYTTASFKNMDFYFEQKNTGKAIIKISMDNDDYNPATKEDRNAFVARIYINKVGM